MVRVVNFDLEAAENVHVLVFDDKISQFVESFNQSCIFLELVGYDAAALFIMVSPCFDLHGKDSPILWKLFLQPFFGIDLFQNEIHLFINLEGYVLRADLLLFFGLILQST
jgi:hypothetical protein